MPFHGCAWVSMAMGLQGPVCCSARPSGSCPAMFCTISPSVARLQGFVPFGLPPLSLLSQLRQLVWSYSRNAQWDMFRCGCCLLQAPSHGGRAEDSSGWATLLALHDLLQDPATVLLHQPGHSQCLCCVSMPVSTILLGKLADSLLKWAIILTCHVCIFHLCYVTDHWQFVETPAAPGE
jgi:hypothetical protein